MTKQLTTVKSLLDQDNVKERFRDIMGKNSAGFTANLAVMVNNNQMLAKCDPMSVVSAAVISASLNLPLDPNLGFAAIVPYGSKAQFQIMYKGLVQLAQRSGQYETIGVTEIYEGQLLSSNPLTGEYEFDFDAKKTDTVIGYAAYFKLINGFKKTVYWSREDVEKHGKRYSKSFNNSGGRWKQDFDAMARKTVLKSLLSKWGILSIELQKAVVYDQGVVQDVTEDADVEYIDNDQSALVEETKDVLNDDKKTEQETIDELAEISQAAQEQDLFDNKK